MGLNSVQQAQDCSPNDHWILCFKLLDLSNLRYIGDRSAISDQLQPICPLIAPSMLRIHNSPIFFFVSFKNAVLAASSLLWAQLKHCLELCVFNYDKCPVFRDEIDKCLRHDFLFVSNPCRCTNQGLCMDCATFEWNQLWFGPKLKVPNRKRFNIFIAKLWSLQVKWSDVILHSLTDCNWISWPLASSRQRAWVAGC